MYLLFYTDNLPENSNGCANAFIIRIRPPGDKSISYYTRKFTSD